MSSPSATIRQRFLQFFSEHGHTIVPSSPVLPHDDPTLLFTNAGMNQFKDLFLGKSRREYSRAATSQKCIRVGGKHNDLDNVGHTRRHLTFFEMLGNFSFGDYFKKEAIDFAWKVVTQVLEFDPDRVWATVFTTDDEAFELWQRYLPVSRIVRLGESDNFWAMGDTGPCGPCSELLYDRGPAYGSAKSPAEPNSGERFLEFWNLVFMQFNRQVDGSLVPLAKPSIDTGAGLERLISLKLDVDTVFGTDILGSIISKIAEVSKIAYLPGSPQAPAFHVIADHLRSLSFSIADGVQPSNLDRGYVLRKLLRRAVRYGKQLGFTAPFLGELLPTLIQEMGDAYPELVSAQKQIQEVLTREEESFFRTLRRGGNLLQQIIENAQATSTQLISGEDAFKLKDTYGLPFEEISLIAKDHHLAVDIERYQELELEAKARSRQAHKTVNQMAESSIFETFLQDNPATTFVGYNQTSCNSKVLGIVKDGVWTQSLEEGESGLIVLEQTPFYAEMGGQVGDRGTLSQESSATLFDVETCQQPFPGVFVHIGQVKQGHIHTGQMLLATIDQENRHKIQCNHTATHLLHWALQEVLGPHIKQAGSLVEAEKLRFDFSHTSGMTPEQIRQVEILVQEEIRKDHTVSWYNMPYSQVQQRQDIKQYFGDKYGTTVRVVDIATSKELCGGTHTSNLAKIGYFRIIKEASCAAGTRRIEAVTGKAAEALAYAELDLLLAAATQMKASPAQLLGRIQSVQEELKEKDLELKRIKEERLSTLAQEIVSSALPAGPYHLAVGELALPPGDLRTLATLISKKLPPNGILLLGTQWEGRATLYLQCEKGVVSSGGRADQWIQAGKSQIQGSGGGKAESAQASSTLVEELTNALNQIKQVIAAS
jgi:alanyl-tRNA synthetase